MVWGCECLYNNEKTQIKQIKNVLKLKSVAFWYKNWTQFPYRYKREK